MTVPSNVLRPMYCTRSVKGKKMMGGLSGLFAFKPNHIEAMALSGCDNTEDAAKWLVEHGVKHVFVSAGADGMVIAERDGDEKVVLSAVPICKTTIKNATGGGDSVMAALIKGYLMGMNSMDAARFAQAAGSITMESEHAIAENMSFENAYKRMEENKL